MKRMAVIVSLLATVALSPTTGADGTMKHKNKEPLESPAKGTAKEKPAKKHGQDKDAKNKKEEKTRQPMKY